jgi:outer membrane biosynthesis protein TonB
MSKSCRKFLISLPILIFLFGTQLNVFAQNVITSSDILRGSRVFVLTPPKRSFTNTVQKVQPSNKPDSKPSQNKNVRPTTALNKPKGSSQTIDEPIAPEDWINEQADNAIEERKISDSEPFLMLSEGYLNSRAYFCESPQFPNAARKAKQKLVKSKVLVTVGQYGGLLNATTIEGDPAFRAAVYKVLGSMSFRQSYFMGKPIRIEGMLNFTQNPDNTVVCRETSQELEVPAVIDGGVLNEVATVCEVPEFPTDAKTAGLKSVEAKIQVTVDEKGNVIEAKPLEGHPTFSQNAVKSALKATFPKSLIAGKPVKVGGILAFKQNPNNDARCGALKTN